MTPPPQTGHTLTIPRSNAEPYLLLIVDIISNALDVATGRIQGNQVDQRRAIIFLRDSKCQRWCELLGFEWSVISASIEDRLQETTNCV